VVRNDVHYFTFEGLNVNVRGKVNKKVDGNYRLIET
jgi:hypothetical protein